MTRELPHSPETESLLLSACLIDESDALTRAVAAGITPATFHDPKHSTAFAALCRLLEAGKAPVPHILAEELQTARQLDAIGGYAFIAQISREVPTSAQAGFFIEKLIEQATLRALIRRQTANVEQCYDWTGGDVHELVESQSADVLAAAPTNSRAESWSDTIAGVQRRIDALTDPTAGPPPNEVSFGFADLDRRFAPMAGGQLVILAARPSVGKSSLARMIAYNAARSGLPVIFASLEVMGASLATNLAQTITGISFRGLRNSHDSDRAEFRQCVGSLALPTLHVLAASQVRIAALRARARLLRARQTPARLIVVDYMQLMPDAEPNRGEQRSASVGRCSRALKQLAIEEDCPVLALSQLNRDSARDGREPALHDLRESGDIEQDADKVIFLHRPAENPITKQPQPEASLPSEVPSFFVNAIQAKGRDDGTAIVSLNFRRAITRFEQISR